MIFVFVYFFVTLIYFKESISNNKLEYLAAKINRLISTVGLNFYY
jgi:hypothetical protein